MKWDRCIIRYFAASVFTTRTRAAITRQGDVMFSHSGMQEYANARTACQCFDPTSRPRSCRPCGDFLHRPLPDTAPRRKDKRAKEGPCLTAPGNDSLQMLCRVTSANHNNPLKPPENVIHRTGPWPFSARIMRPRDKHLHRRRGEKEERLLEVQLCFTQMN